MRALAKFTSDQKVSPSRGTDSGDAYFLFLRYFFKIKYIIVAADNTRVPSANSGTDSIVICVTLLEIEWIARELIAVMILKFIKIDFKFICA